MKTPQQQKAWYKKKRYITSAVLLGLLLISGQESDPEVISSSFSEPLPVQAEVANPVPKEQVKTIERVQETKSCNSNYSGCLKPDASDYDCSGGSGNGPYYTGAVQVLGYDEYDLDRDGDGWGCE